MNAAQEALARLQAELRVGMRPRALETYIEEETASKRGWFARLFTPPYSVDPWCVARIESLETECLRTSTVFRVYAMGDILETRILPSGGSVGLFALGPRGFLYLSRNQAAVEQLLGEERPALQEADAITLAHLFAEALLQKGNEHTTVLLSEDAVNEWPGGYEVDAGELLRLRDRIAAPSLQRLASDTYRGNGETSYRLTFCGLHGWMHEQNKLVSVQVDISDVYRLTIRRLVLSTKLFRQMPVVMY